MLNLPWLLEGQPVPARARALSVPSQAQGTQVDPNRAALTLWTAGLHPHSKCYLFILRTLQIRRVTPQMAALNDAQGLCRLPGAAIKIFRAKVHTQIKQNATLSRGP